ncbi:MAG: hypothetical protein PHI79_04660 [Sulfurovaceae bacterium]|nr:hypothetical protein [Sulfurovaceae bacterium]MDD5548876.1 hypothetical protein [Sulfurovaceae bacterium]
MKDILIIAEGVIAKHFILWLNKKKIIGNHYNVISTSINFKDIKLSKNITYSRVDATSESKIQKIFSQKKYSHIFIIIENFDDVEHILQNINKVDNKIRIILANHWENDKIFKHTNNITLININDLISSNLYDKLPNVPLVANNIGLREGEIMEIHIPFGSSYAYRHIGSILQQKWKIVALYRNDKMIMPNSATMIKPNDTILTVGKPSVLEGIYRIVNRRRGLFPEPFGKNIYLLLDLRFDKKNAINYIEQAIAINKMVDNNSKLFIHIIYPPNLRITEKIKEIATNEIKVDITFDLKGIDDIIEYNTTRYDIGLVICSNQTFYSKHRKMSLYNLKKIIYIIGQTEVSDIKNVSIIMGEEEAMESISMIAFDFSQTFKLPLKLCDFDPNGDFEERKMTIEHYETIANLFNAEFSVEQRIANPYKEQLQMKDTLNITAFKKQNINLLTRLKDLVKTTYISKSANPQMLIPFENSES